MINTEKWQHVPTGMNAGTQQHLDRQLEMRAGLHTDGETPQLGLFRHKQQLRTNKHTTAMSLVHTALQVSPGHTSERSQTSRSPIWDPGHMTRSQHSWSPGFTFELMLSMGRRRMGGLGTLGRHCLHIRGTGATLSGF